MRRIIQLVKFMRRYGLAYTITSFKRKLGIGEHDIMITNIPLMQTCKKMTVEEYPAALCEWYERSVGKRIDLEHPRTFTEKIQWLKLYDTTELKTVLSDKYLAPKYVKEKCGDLIEIVPQVGAWDSPNSIDIETLPDKFVLKCNHGSGMNIIVKNKKEWKFDESRELLQRWMNIDFEHILGDFEMQYADIERKIIAEEYIEEFDGNLHDYKVHCFNGKPKIIQFIGDRNPEKHTGEMAFYDIEWNLLDCTTGDYPSYKKVFPAPKTLCNMLRISEILSEPFYYVRVDLYEINGKTYFGELTFTPGGGCYPKLSPEWVDKQWGSMIKLPID